MKIGLIKWLYQGDSLYNEVKKQLNKSVDISNLSKEDIENTVSDIYKNNKSYFEDSKKSAIKSTIKEFIREHKTYAIANLLETNRADLKASTTLTHTEQDKEQALESLANAIILKKNNNDPVSLLNNDEIKIVVRNYSALTNYLEQSQVIDKGNVSTDHKLLRETGKPMMRDIEKKLPMKIPSALKDNYEKWCRIKSNSFYDDKNISDYFKTGNDIKGFATLLTDDLKRNLFNGMNERELNLIIETANILDEPLYTKRHLESFADSCTLIGGSFRFKFSHDQRKALKKLAANNPTTKTVEKVRTLQKLANKNKRILSCFSNTEIRLMNLIFKVELPTE